ncbi:MAG: hypothetical protein FWF81_04825 [Defluviitaleaceae bacterium]|nr:hypothetical protein [Defluviitaleaceae bacterium]
MEIEKLLEIMDVLLGENGCPWDREQTHESLRKYLIEECEEAVEAIDSGDASALCEELGDVLLQVVFHAKLAQKSGKFNFDDVVRGISDKLVRRHTHVFGDDIATSIEDVAKIWNKNKAAEQKNSQYSVFHRQ